MKWRYVCGSSFLLAFAFLFQIATSAALGDAPRITISGQPQKTIAEKGAASFTVQASVDQGASLSYQWQVSKDKGVSFSDLTAQTSSTLLLSNLNYASDNGSYYRCKLSAPGATTVNSKYALLTVYPPRILITAQPANIISKNGVASFLVVAKVDQGVSLSYQWQVSKDKGVSFSDVDGENRESISLSGLTYAIQNNYYYRVSITAPNATPVKSGAARLTVPPPTILITSQSKNTTSKGGGASFSVAAKVDQGVSLSYQWQIYKYKGSSVSDITGETNSTLSLSNLTYATNNGSYYRCKLSAPGAASIFTSYALLTVPPPTITITAHPQKMIAEKGTANFSVEASIDQGASLSYQWQVLKYKTSTYSDVPGETNSKISLSNLTNGANNGSYYRCKVSVPGRETVTRSALLTVYPPRILITAQPANKTAKDGVASFAVAAKADQSVSLNYQWQVSTDKGASFADVAGENKESISLSGLTYAIHNNYYYRVSITAPDAKPLNSRAALLTVPFPPVPSVTSISQSMGKEGDKIVISGSGFKKDMLVDARPVGATQSISVCKLGDSNCSFDSASITVQKLPPVPSGMTLPQDFEIRITYTDASGPKLSESMVKFSYQDSKRAAEPNTNVVSPSTNFPYRFSGRFAVDNVFQGDKFSSLIGVPITFDLGFESIKRVEGPFCNGERRPDSCQMFPSGRRSWELTTGRAEINFSSESSSIPVGLTKKTLDSIRMVLTVDSGSPMGTLSLFAVDPEAPEYFGFGIDAINFPLSRLYGSRGELAFDYTIQPFSISDAKGVSLQRYITPFAMTDVAYAGTADFSSNRAISVYPQGGTPRTQPLFPEGYAFTQCDSDNLKFDVYVTRSPFQPDGYDLTVLPLSVNNGDIAGIYMASNSGGVRPLNSPLVLRTGQPFRVETLLRGDLTQFPILAISPYDFFNSYATQISQNSAFCSIPGFEPGGVFAPTESNPPYLVASGELRDNYVYFAPVSGTVSMTCKGDQRTYVNIWTGDDASSAVQLQKYLAGQKTEDVLTYEFSVPASKYFRVECQGYSSFFASFKPTPINPELTSISPGTGPQSQSQSITLVGKNLSAVRSVVFRTYNGTAFNCENIVSSPTLVTCNRPAQVAGGMYSVQVDPGNNSPILELKNALEVVSAPVITELHSPPRGSAEGGDRLELTGKYFDSAAVVRFGTKDCTQTWVYNSIYGESYLGCVIPALDPGTYDIVLTNKDGQTSVLSGAYKAVGKPTILSVSPTSASEGETIKITGKYLPSRPGLDIRKEDMFLRTPEGTCQFVSLSEINCTIPQLGLAINPDGSSVELFVSDPVESVSARFPFLLKPKAVPKPSITSITPDSGKEGDTVTISGSGFASGMLVDARPVGATQSISVCKLGDANCSFDSASITIQKLPPVPSGIILPQDFEIRMTYFEGTQPKLSESMVKFRYEFPSPRVVSITPTGKEGDVLEISGEKFNAGMWVSATNLRTQQQLVFCRLQLPDWDHFLYQPCVSFSSEKITFRLPEMAEDTILPAEFEVRIGYFTGNEEKLSQSSLRFTYLDWNWVVCGQPGNGCYDNAQAMADGRAKLIDGRKVILDRLSSEGADAFKVWREKTGDRILSSTGVWESDNDWQKFMGQFGYFYDEEVVGRNAYLHVTGGGVAIAGRVCPPNVFLNHQNMMAEGRCLYYNVGLEPSADQVLTSFSPEESNFIPFFGKEGLSGQGASTSYYEGNRKSCNYFRLPTIYETQVSQIPSGLDFLPTGDGITPVWAGEKGVPSKSLGDVRTGGNFIGGGTFTASSTSRQFIMLGWEQGQLKAHWPDGPGFNSTRCVLPANRSSFPMVSSDDPTRCEITGNDELNSTREISDPKTSFLVNVKGATGSSFKFGSIGYGRFSVPLNKINQFSAEATFMISGGENIKTTVYENRADGSKRELNCRLTINRGPTAGLALALTGQRVGPLGGTVTLTPKPSGFDPEKTVSYRLSILENNERTSAFRAFFSSDGITVQALDNSIHSNVTLNIRAFTDPSQYADTSVSLAFFPPLTCRYYIRGASSFQLPAAKVDVLAEAFDPSTGQWTKEKLEFSDMLPAPHITVVGGPGQSGVALTFDQAGDYLPALRFRSPLRNQYCSWVNSTNVSSSPDYLHIPIEISN
jgi:hypothetical protein